MKRKIFITTIMAMFIAIVAFGQDSDKKTKEKVKETKKEMSDVNRDINRADSDDQTFAEFRRDTEKRLDKIDRNLDDLTVKVDKMDESDRSTYQDRLKELKEKNRELRRKLTDFKDEDNQQSVSELQRELQHDFKVLDKALDTFFEDNKK